LKNKSIQNQRLKKDMPLWKRFFRFSVPAMTLGNIVIIIFLSALTILGSVIFWPTRSTIDYESATVETTEFRFTNMKLHAYGGMHYEFTQTKSDGKARGTMGGSSNEGGIRLSGSVTNTTDSNLFLTDAFPPNTFLYDDSPSFYMILNDHDHQYTIPMIISGSPFAVSGQDGEFAGYQIKPNQKLDFELIEFDMTIKELDEFTLRFEWTILGSQNLRPHTIRPEFHFTREGTTILWGSTDWRMPHFKWFRDAPVPSTN
jgi:hypothetical protein